MSREIKFRAWEEECNFMNDQVRIIVNPFGCGETYYQVTDATNWIDVPRHHVMQWTGLKDKNGVEIFEGDFVRVTLSSYERLLGFVKWFGDDNYPAFDLHQVNEAFYFDSNILSTVMNDGSEVEVIGNIYENPQLLKEDTR